jgi:hypothetical protein
MDNLRWGLVALLLSMPACTQPIGIVGRCIPNSPTNVIDAGLTAQRESGWFGALRARHFGESPLVEDNSVRSPAYTTVDAQPILWCIQACRAPFVRGSSISSKDRPRHRCA